MKTPKLLLASILPIVIFSSVVFAENMRDFFKNHLNSTLSIWIGAGTTYVAYGKIVEVQEDYIVIDAKGQKQYICISQISRWVLINQEKSKKNL